MKRRNLLIGSLLCFLIAGFIAYQIVWAFPPTALVTGLSNNSNVAITGGAIDGVTIGGTTPAAGKFTDLNASGVITVTGATWTGLEVDVHASKTLSAADCYGKIWHNIGQNNTSANITLPPPAAGMSFILPIGETSSANLIITGAANSLRVDGVPNCTSAYYATPTEGDWLMAFTRKVSGAYKWIITTGAGTLSTL